MDDKAKMVLAELGEEEILCQLAEECDELGKAALKLRRVLSGKNPTPVTEAEARANLIEEIADVDLCLDVLGLNTYMNGVTISIISDKKLTRWVKRLDGDMSW